MLNLPEEVVEKLDAAAKRVRKILVLRGLAVTVAVFLVTVMLAMAADAYFTIFDDRVRYSISAGVWAATAVAAFFAVWGPFRYPVTRRRAAKVLDERHPENEERLTTLVEIVERAERGDDNTSESLFRHLAREGVICANRIDILREFTARTIVRRLKVLAAVAAVLVLSFAVFPGITGLLFVRAACPWIDVGNLYGDYLEVTPGSVAVLKGTTVEIKAKAVRKLPGEMTIRISRRQDGKWGREFAEPLPESGYRTTADLQEREWRYRVSCGPAVTRYFTVRVCEEPKYRLFTARLDYPAYTGRAPFTYTNEAVGAIQAIEGTKVTFSLKVDEPGTTSELRLMRGHELNLLSDNGHLVGEMISNKVSSWSMELTSADGFKSPRRGGPFVSVRDQSPTVVIESPKAKLRLPTHAKFPIAFLANDDIGVRTVTIRYSINDAPREEMRTDRYPGQRAFLKDAVEIDLSCFNLLDARTFTADLVVCDGYPDDLGGPHAATSTPVVVEFEQSAKSFEEQNLAEQLKESAAELQEAEKRLETAERLAREAQGQVQRDRNQVSEQTERKVEQLAHEIKEAEKRAEELSEKLQEDGKFDKVAEELERVTETEMAPVREELAKAQFASPEERAEALARLQPMLQAAKEKMKAAEQEMKERGEKLASYEKTKDLADRQEALAKAAKAIMEEKPVDTKKLEAWKRMEEAAAKEAAEISKKLPEPGIDEARREMEKAADEMKALKDELDIRNDKNLNDEQREKKLEALAKSQAQAREKAKSQAAAAEKAAVDALAKAIERREQAAKTQDPNQQNRLNAEAVNFERTAAQQQSAAEDRLMEADATDAQRTAQQEASEALREASAPEADRLAELKEALAEQQEALQALEPPAEAAEAANARPPAAANAQSPSDKTAAMQKALAALQRAEAAEERALDALEQRDAEAALKAIDEATIAQSEARAAHAANALEAAEKAESRAAESVARAKQNGQENQYRDAAARQNEALENLRAAEDAIAAALGADERELEEMRRIEGDMERIRDEQNAAVAAERRATDAIRRNDRNAAAAAQQEAARRADRAHGMMEAQRQAFEEGAPEVAERLAEAAEAEEQAMAAQAAAAQAQELAAKSNRAEDRAAAAQAQQAAVEAQQAANEKMEAAAEAAESSAGGQQPSGEQQQSGEQQPSGEQQSGTQQSPSGEQQSGQQQSGEQQSGQQSGGQQSSEQQNGEQSAGGGSVQPDETAEKAAEGVKSEAARMAAALGIRSPQSSEAGAGEQQQQDNQSKGAGGQASDEKSGGGGGGIRRELEKLAKDLKRNDLPQFLRGKVSNAAWFRIRGSVREGLGERDLKDIPAEYRDLVRRYFLRLVDEEAPAN